MCTRFHFRHAFEICRQETLSLATDVQPGLFKRQAHPAFSPIGWHLGHIAYTESLWILEHLAGQSCGLSQDKKLFSSDGLPKVSRENVPDLSEVLGYISWFAQIDWSFGNATKAIGFQPIDK